MRVNSIADIVKIISTPTVLWPMAEWNPPTVADTKRNFYESFSRPIPGIYSNVIQELLVQQHIMRYNKSYSYDEASHSVSTSSGCQLLFFSITVQNMCGTIACNIHMADVVGDHAGVWSGFCQRL